MSVHYKSKTSDCGQAVEGFYQPSLPWSEQMTDFDFTEYPSLEEQAIEVSNDLHDELHITIDQIRTDVSPKASVLVYVELINMAKTMHRNLLGGA